MDLGGGIHEEPVEFLGLGTAEPGGLDPGLEIVGLGDDLGFMQDQFGILNHLRPFFFGEGFDVGRVSFGLNLLIEFGDLGIGRASAYR